MKKQLLSLILLLSFPAFQAMGSQISQAAALDDTESENNGASAASAVRIMTVREAIGHIAENLGASDVQVGEVTRRVRLCAGGRQILDTEVVARIEQQLRQEFGQRDQESMAIQTAENNRQLGEAEEAKQSMEDFEAEQQRMLNKEYDEQKRKTEEVHRHLAKLHRDWALEEVREQEKRRYWADLKRDRDLEEAHDDLIRQLETEVAAIVLAKDVPDESTVEALRVLLKGEKSIFAHGKMVSVQGVPTNILSRIFKDKLSTHIRHFDEWSPILQLMVDYGANLDVCDRYNGRTLLLDNLDENNYTGLGIDSYCQKRQKIIEFLIKNGASVDHHNKDGESAVRLALNPSMCSQWEENRRPAVHGREERLRRYHWFKDMAVKELARTNRADELEFLLDHRLPEEESRVQFHIFHALQDVLSRDPINIVCGYAATSNLLTLRDYSSRGRTPDESREYGSVCKKVKDNCAIL